MAPGYAQNMATTEDTTRVNLRLPAALHQRIKAAAGDRGVNAYLTALAERDLEHRELAEAFDRLGGLNLLMPEAMGDIAA